MRGKLGTIFFVIYAVIAITVTVLLLSFNDYLCSEIGGYTVYIANDDTLSPDYPKGNLLLIKQTKDNNVNIGDELLLYQNISRTEYQVEKSVLEEKSLDGRHTIYRLEDGSQFDSSYLIGKTSETISIPYLGTVLSILESRWGYLFCVVIVTLFLFLQELYDLFIEIKYGNEQDEEEVKPKKKSVNGTRAAKGSR